VRARAASVLRRGPDTAKRLAYALQADDPATRLLACSGYVHADLRRELFGGALAEHSDAAERILQHTATGVRRAAPLEAALYLDARLDLADRLLMYFDRASMASSLEVRVPFLDHEFVELGATVPAAHKIRWLQSKHVLREAAQGLVPDFVLAKKKESFLAASVGRWLSAADRGLVDRVLLRAEPAYGSVINPSAVRRAVAEWRAGRKDNEKLLLALVMLELWLSEYLPRSMTRFHERVAA
jgi:asparagine synthase (glutamine-hydrolysing)